MGTEDKALSGKDEERGGGKGEGDRERESVCVCVREREKHVWIGVLFCLCTLLFLCFFVVKDCFFGTAMDLKTHPLDQPLPRVPREVCMHMCVWLSHSPLSLSLSLSLSLGLSLCLSVSVSPLLLFLCFCN